VTPPPLPGRAYVPGRGPHPGRAAPERDAPPEETQSRAADLFDRGYYWEAHEAWEGLWRTHARRSPEGRRIAGLIALAAAGVKAREGNVRGVVRHARRAAAIFRALEENEAADGSAALVAFAEAIAAAPPCRPAVYGDPAEAVFDAALPVTPPRSG